MYDSAEVNQFNMVIPNKEVLLNESHNGLYYYDMEDRDLVPVNMGEENWEGFSRRELSGSKEDRWALTMFG